MVENINCSLIDSETVCGDDVQMKYAQWLFLVVSFGSVTIQLYNLESG